MKPDHSASKTQNPSVLTLNISSWLGTEGCALSAEKLVAFHSFQQRCLFFVLTQMLIFCLKVSFPVFYLVICHDEVQNKPH